MTNPWDVAPVLKRGDSTATEIYTAVGYALTVWANLEFELFCMYGVLAHSKNFASQAAYGAVLSFETRIEMILAAAKARYRYLSEPNSHSALEKLLRSIGRLSSRRNDIAHGQVMCFASDGYYLVHAIYDTRKRSKLTRKQSITSAADVWSYAYTAAQINSYTTVFLSYREHLRAIDRSVSQELLNANVPAL